MLSEPGRPAERVPSAAPRPPLAPDPPSPPPPAAIHAHLQLLHLRPPLCVSVRLCVVLPADPASGECIYVKQWHDRERPSSPDIVGAEKRASTGFKDKADAAARRADGRLSVQDDAKLIFGVVFSLRNMVRKLSGP